MMIATWFGLAMLAIKANATEIPDSAKVVEAPLHRFECNMLEGGSKDLGDYQGKVVMVVNVASFCGLTPQYAGLQDLYQAYADRGFEILGFPCNDFGAQEPGSPAEIRQFCAENYEVSFPLFSKVKVSGDGTAPLYRYLTETGPLPGPVAWNFQKYVFGRDGQLVARFDPQVAPADESLVKTIEQELARAGDKLVVPDPGKGAVAKTLARSLKDAEAANKPVLVLFTEPDNEDVDEFSVLLDGPMGELWNSAFHRMEIDASSTEAAAWLEFYGQSSNLEAPFFCWLNSDGFVTGRSLNAVGENIALPFTPTDAEAWLALVKRHVRDVKPEVWKEAKETFLEAGGY